MGLCFLRPALRTPGCTGRVPSFAAQPRRERSVPHIGNVELATRHADALSMALPSVVAR